ncbi:hypothetical protein OB905_07680 [Halobacteria archaeon AArc-dxtr1]|nr:hypothetical protein [Halobacteria archaeon AArc-dxtr1]
MKTSTEAQGALTHEQMVQPPSPTMPTIAADAQTTDDSGRVLTTPQLLAGVEDAFDHRLDETLVDEVLVELDRRGYVEWIGVSRSGDYVWDFSESPERIAETIAQALVDRLQEWLEGDCEA